MIKTYDLFILILLIIFKDYKHLPNSLFEVRFLTLFNQKG